MLKYHSIKYFLLKGALNTIKFHRIYLVHLFCFCILTFIFFSGGSAYSLDDSTCIKKGVTLQILGSGGPFAGDQRASSGYLIWVKDRPYIMIDAGGGTFLRLQQAGARIDDIKLICISHFHPDHASELPAFLWSDLYSSRKTPLIVTGPSGKGSSGLTGFLTAITDMVNGSDVFTRVNSIEVTPQKNNPSVIHKDDVVEVLGIGVNHYKSPTIAYRFNIGDVSIGYGADQTLDNPEFIKLVQGVDVLILHLPVAENATFPALLHAKPSVVGKAAQKTEAPVLVLSHFMKLDTKKQFASELSLSDLNSNLERVKKYYSGTVILADDLQCIEVKKKSSK